jgi:hypothetical protein
MYGEPSVEVSQEAAWLLESCSGFLVPSGAAGCSAAGKLAETKISPVNTIAHRVTGAMASRPFKFILISPIYSFWVVH